MPAGFCWQAIAVIDIRPEHSQVIDIKGIEWLVHALLNAATQISG